MLRNSSQAWGSVAKFFHWAMAALILNQFVLGLLAVSWPLSPTKLELFIWHKSFGLAVLALVALRLGWRLANPTPQLPGALPPWERAAARASHALLYAVMVAMPMSGWVVNSASNIPFRVFWLFPLPSIVAPDKALAATAKDVHFALAVALATLLAIHIGAALRHHFILRNDVLARMLPGARR